MSGVPITTKTAQRYLVGRTNEGVDVERVEGVPGSEPVHSVRYLRLSDGSRIALGVEWLVQVSSSGTCVKSVLRTVATMARYSPRRQRPLPEPRTTTMTHAHTKTPGGTYRGVAIHATTTVLSERLVGAQGDGIDWPQHLADSLAVVYPGASVTVEIRLDLAIRVLCPDDVLASQIEEEYPGVHQDIWQALCADKEPKR